MNHLATEAYTGGGAMGAQPPPWKSEGFDFQGGFSPQRGLSPPPVKKWPNSTALPLPNFKKTSAVLVIVQTSKKIVQMSKRIVQMRKK